MQSTRLPSVLAAGAVASGIGAVAALAFSVIQSWRVGMAGFARVVEFDATGAVRADAVQRAAERAAAASGAAAEAVCYALAAALGLFAVIGGLLTYPHWRRWPWLALTGFVPALVAFYLAITRTLLGGQSWPFVELVAAAAGAASAVPLIRARYATPGRIIGWSNVTLGAAAILLRLVAGVR